MIKERRNFVLGLLVAPLSLLGFGNKEKDIMSTTTTFESDYTEEWEKYVKDCEECIEEWEETLEEKRNEAALSEMNSQYWQDRCLKSEKDLDGFEKAVEEVNILLNQEMCAGSYAQRFVINKRITEILLKEYYKEYFHEHCLDPERNEDLYVSVS